MGLKTAGATAVSQHPKLKFLLAMRYQTPPWAGLVGVSVLAVYLSLLPFVARTWRTTGDEPHYLLAAHSLVTDLDFDLTNNYAGFDYLAFYFSKDIVPQVRLNATGQQILDHYPGLPVLIAPAYALGGRFGVLIFQAMLGALLAAITFKLAYFFSQDEIGSLLATLFVAFSPPLLMYQYLVYPEVIGALLITLVLYYALTRNEPATGIALLVLVSLAILPWLNRRFIPLAIFLALLIGWSWRRQTSRTPLFTRVGLASLLVTALSIGLVMWFNSQLTFFDQVDVTAPADSTAIWSRLVRGAGWLVDQQRGLFVYAPIYVGAIWGVPILFEDSLKWRSRRWSIVLPLLLSMSVTMLAGGFWIAWELGPRFLVVVLPTLAPLLALAWRNYGHKKLWATAVILLVVLSFANSVMIIKNPELPYKSSLPLFYGEKLSLPLTAVLPDLAEYTRITPLEANSSPTQMTSQAGEPAWLVEGGGPLNLVQTEPLVDLPFGHYILSWPLRTEANLPPDTELLRITVKSLGGGQLFNRLVTAAELPADGSFGTVEDSLLNTNVDRWRTPMTLHAVTTGQANLWAKDLWLSPSPFYALFLPYLYLALLSIGAVVTWSRATGVQKDDEDFVQSAPPGPPKGGEKSEVPPSGELAGIPPSGGLEGIPPSGGLGGLLSAKSSPPGPPKGGEKSEVPPSGELARVSTGTRPASLGEISEIPPSGGLGGPRHHSWAWLLFVPLAVAGYLVYAQTRPGRTYDVNDLGHFVGQSVTDSDARDGRAWLVDPAVDPPQRASYGPFDIYDAGQYRVTFRIKLPQAVETGQEIARLQVSATANFDQLVAQPLLVEHFSGPDLYHDLTLTVDNPRRQALSFEVHYLGLAPLVIDEVTIFAIKTRYNF